MAENDAFMSDAAKEAARLRWELAQNLTAIEARLNVPKRVARRITVFKRRKPALFALAASGIGAATAAAVAGIVVLSVVSRRRCGDR